jgi:opacity protein-like surface antigen
MNTAGRPTTVQSTTEELLIRTLSSDISSLQHGNQAPVPEHVTAHFTEQTEEEAQPHPHHSSAFGVIVALLVVVGLGYALYLYLTPYIIGGVV